MVRCSTQIATSTGLSWLEILQGKLLTRSNTALVAWCLTHSSVLSAIELSFLSNAPSELSDQQQAGLDRIVDKIQSLRTKR